MGINGCGAGEKRGHSRHAEDLVSALVQPPAQQAATFAGQTRGMLVLPERERLQILAQPQPMPELRQAQVGLLQVGAPGGAARFAGRDQPGLEVERRVLHPLAQPQAVRARRAVTFPGMPPVASPARLKPLLSACKPSGLDEPGPAGLPWAQGRLWPASPPATAASSTTR